VIVILFHLLLCLIFFRLHLLDLFPVHSSIFSNPTNERLALGTLLSKAVDMCSKQELLPSAGMWWVMLMLGVLLLRQLQVLTRVFSFH
jgi:hypothetical protein